MSNQTKPLSLNDDSLNAPPLKAALELPVHNTAGDVREGCFMQFKRADNESPPCAVDFGGDKSALTFIKQNDKRANIILVAGLGVGVASQISEMSDCSVAYFHCDCAPDEIVEENGKAVAYENAYADFTQELQTQILNLSEAGMDNILVFYPNSSLTDELTRHVSVKHAESKVDFYGVMCNNSAHKDIRLPPKAVVGERVKQRIELFSVAPDLPEGLARDSKKARDINSGVAIPEELEAVETPIILFGKPVSTYKGTVSLISARSGVGKTSFGMECVWDSLFRGERVIVINPEMDSAGLFERLYQVGSRRFIPEAANHFDWQRAPESVFLYRCETSEKIIKLAYRMAKRFIKRNGKMLIVHSVEQAPVNTDNLRDVLLSYNDIVGTPNFVLLDSCQQLIVSDFDSKEHATARVAEVSVKLATELRARFILTAQQNKQGAEEDGAARQGAARYSEGLEQQVAIALSVMRERYRKAYKAKKKDDDEDIMPFNPIDLRADSRPDGKKIFSSSMFVGSSKMRFGGAPVEMFDNERYFICADSGVLLRENPVMLHKLWEIYQDQNINGLAKEETPQRVKEAYRAAFPQAPMPPEHLRDGEVDDAPRKEPTRKRPVKPENKPVEMK